MHIIQGAHPSPLDQAGTHTTMERIAAHIPGTTEYEPSEPPNRFGFTSI